MDTQHLRTLIGCAAMGLVLLVARFAIPTATVPEPDIGCIQLEHRDFARDTFEQCGGGVPFLVHTDTVGTTTPTRFELYPRGEWKRFSDSEPGGVALGCIDSEGVSELRALLDRATWKREPSKTWCDIAFAGSEVWQVNGVEKLSYNPCDRTLPDRPTTALVDAVHDFEARLVGQPWDRRDANLGGPGCPADTLACYEWNVGEFFPTAKFVVDKTGAWEITQRDVQSEQVTLHAKGTFTVAEVTELRARIDRAPWKLVPTISQCSDSMGNGTVSTHGGSITWNLCDDKQPDPTTQIAVDRLFELYRSALGSLPHI